MRKGLAAELLTLLKLDGSRAMTGNLNFLNDFEIQKGGVKQIEYTTAGDRVHIVANLRGYGQSQFDSHFTMSGITDDKAIFYAITSAVNKKLRFMIYDGVSAYEEVMALVGRQGAGLSYVNIPLAGDILPVVGKSCGTTVKPFNYMEATHVRGANHLSGGYVHFDPTTGPAFPVEGDERYNSVLQKKQIYNGAAWETITSA